MPIPAFVSSAPQPWPSGHGELVAVLQTSLEELKARFGLELFEGHDNLDHFDAASLTLQPSGRRVGLLRHRGDPEPGIELHADALDDPGVVARELLAALDLPWSACSWIRPAEAQAERPAVRSGSRLR